MNTEKFTQGEWHIEEEEVKTGDFYLFGFSILTKEHRICMCRTDNPEDMQTLKANANLISAAPEMYRMLESVHRLLNGYILEMPIRTDIKHQQIEFNAKRIEELLKKARGEE